MGLINGLLGLVFGNGRNVLRETAEVFVENADAGAARGAAIQAQTLSQYASEFAVPRRGGFDRFMDGINRVPRPALALGTMGLFVAAMIDPLWFAARMQGIALVPEPLWWLLGVIVSFYFGARHQRKTQDFQRDIAATMARVPEVMQNVSAIETLRAQSIGAADPGADAHLAVAAVTPEANRALEDWKALRRA